MLRTLLTVVGLCLVTQNTVCVLAQEKAPFRAGVIFEGQPGLTIPDPNNLTSLVSLVRNITVARAIGLSSEQQTLLNNYFSKNGGSFNVRIIKPEDIMSKTREEADREYKNWLAENRSILDEILSPEQVARLKQAAYQVEVGRIGIGEALATGALGRDCGVNENQKTHLLQAAAKAEERAQKEIAAILARTQQEVLAELSPQQRKAAGELLGKPFYFRDDLGRKMANPSAISNPASN